MKTMNNINKGLFAVLFTFSLSGLVSAQQSDNATASATADVLTAVEVTKQTDLVFGNITPGNTKTVGVESDIVNGRAGGTTESAAQFTVSKGASSEVILSFTLPSQLSTDDNDNLTINFADDGSTKLSRLTTSDDADGNNKEDFTPGVDFVTLTAENYKSYFDATSFYVWLGGTVVPSNDQAQGKYSGEITLSATYN
jgi:hypothetical protein